QEARFQTYRARIAAAVAALEGHDVVNAAQQLEEAPEELRGWEWHHLHSRLDDSTAVIPWPRTKGNFLFGAPDALQAGIVTPDGPCLTDLESGRQTTLPIRPDSGRHFYALPTRRGVQIVAPVGHTVFELLDETGRLQHRLHVPESRGWLPGWAV